MSNFKQIPESTFNDLQMDAGVLLSKFDPTGTEPVVNADIICATTGGFNATCQASYSDYGEDIDNCPTNMMELKHLDTWDCRLSFTSLGVSPAQLHLALGAADIDGDASDHITLRSKLDATKDFRDVWWVGNKGGGGMLAVHLRNALSSSGFSLQTTKNGKGQLSVELTGHVSLRDQTTMPMEFYSTEGDDTAANTALANEING